MCSRRLSSAKSRAARATCPPDQGLIRRPRASPRRSSSIRNRKLNARGAPALSMVRTQTLRRLLRPHLFLTFRTVGGLIESDEFERLHPEQTRKSLTARLEPLGFLVTLAPKPLIESS